MNITNSIDGLRLLPTERSVADVLSSVESIARDKGMMIFARIDFSGDAARAGLTQRPCGLVLLGNPKGGTALMVAAPTVAIDLPLKVLAFEAEYLQRRHHFPLELTRNIAALATLAAAAAAG
jgi:uncharacterized protein (DUF302 family)